MPALLLPPAWSAFTAFTRFAPPQPLRTFFRSTAYKFSPPRPHLPQFTGAQNFLLTSGRAELRQRSSVLCEKRGGAVPTIVLGGFVPDATEQVYLLREFLLRQGSMYYFNYPRAGFSLDLVCAQLDDLVNEINERHGQRPVILGVSFGAGLVLEWLRRARLESCPEGHAGVVLVSPVACTADILGPGETKPSTLMGRALKPLIDAGAHIEQAAIEKARVVFTKMFEAGARNKASLRSLMSSDELRSLRAGALGAIQAIEAVGACERVAALNQMSALSAWGDSPRPLSERPALVLYAEKENAVLAASSPTRAALDTTLSEFFPQGRGELVCGGSSPVQHASLIFHHAEFLPPIAKFYREIKSRGSRLAA